MSSKKPMIIIPLIYLICHFGADAAWILSDIKMSRDVDETAIGFYENEIYIFGGWQYQKQLMRYNVIEEKFTDNGINALPLLVGGDNDGQFYHQYANILYMANDNRFAIYNFQTHQFIDHWDSITIPTSVGQREPCLVATHQYLFVIGGYVNGQVFHSVQTFNLLSTSWTTTHMNVARREMMNYTNSTNHEWTILNDTLATPCVGSRALTHEATNQIFVIGGALSEAEEDSVDTMYIIDTITKQVTLSSDRLPYSVATCSAIILNNILYCFGGWGGQPASKHDTWLYYVIATDSPSNEPTQNTKIPTRMPTVTYEHHDSQSNATQKGHFLTHHPTASQTPPIKTTTVSFTTATTVNGSSSYNESNNWWIILLVAIPSPILLFLSAYGMRKCYLNRKIKRREQVKKAGNIAIDDVVEYTVEGPHKNHSVMPYTNEGPQQDNDKAMIRKVEEDIDENKLWNKKVHLINAVYCTEDGTVKTQHEGEANQNVTRGDAGCTGNIDIGDDECTDMGVELGDALYKRCVDCGKQDFGKIYGADGLFYCNQCWLCYGDTHGSNQ
eukprot:564944_1